MAAINLPNEEIGKIEKVGEKLKLIKVIEDVVSRKAREQDNARNAIYAEFQNRIRELERKNERGTPIKEAVYITIIVVIFALLSSSLWQLTKYGAQIEEQRQQIEEYRGKISVLSSRVSELAQQMSKEQRIRETTDCSKVTLNDAKVMSGNGGLFDIYPSFTKTEVFCDLNTDGGGWTVIQRRVDGSENFYRGWDDYVRGFGDLKKEFWIGLGKLHRMTGDASFELRIDFEDCEGNKPYAKYRYFAVGDSVSKYILRVDGYSGTAGDALQYHDGHQFATFDQDNAHQCANTYRGAWWYDHCHDSNFNGMYMKGGNYKTPNQIGVEWYQYKNAHFYSMKFVEMKIRPRV